MKNEESSELTREEAVERWKRRIDGSIEEPKRTHIPEWPDRLRIIGLTLSLLIVILELLVVFPFLLGVAHYSRPTLIGWNIIIIPAVVGIVSVAVACYRELIGGVLLIAEGLLCLMVLLVLPPSVLRNNLGIFYLWPWVLLLIPGIIFLASWLAGRK